MVEATVLDTAELRWWLLGFGDGVEVLAPEVLRQDFQMTALRMAAYYRPAPSEREDAVAELSSPGRSEQGER
jgi:hypothetical protein